MACDNCGQATCNVHMHSYSRKEELGNNRARVIEREYCSVCFDLYKMIDEEQQQVTCYTMLACITVVLLPFACYWGCQWEQRIAAKFREYNRKVDPKICVKIARGRFTGYVYPHGPDGVPLDPSQLDTENLPFLHTQGTEDSGDCNLHGGNARRLMQIGGFIVFAVVFVVIMIFMFKANGVL